MDSFQLEGMSYLTLSLQLEQNTMISVQGESPNPAHKCAYIHTYGRCTYPEVGGEKGGREGGRRGQGRKRKKERIKREKGRKGRKRKKIDLHA